MNILRLLTVSVACALPVGLVGCAHHHHDDDDYHWRERPGYWEHRHPYPDRWDGRDHREWHGRWDDDRYR